MTEQRPSKQTKFADMFIKVWTLDDPLGTSDFAQNGRKYTLRFCKSCRKMKPKTGETANASTFTCEDCSTARPSDGEV